MRILVFGSCTLDAVTRVPHVVAPGETLPAGDRRIYCGGKGLNQAVAAARAGAQVRMAGCIGKADGQPLRDFLRDAGVDLSLLRETDDVPSGQSMIQVTDAGENAILIFPGANRALTDAQIASVFAACAPGECLVLQNETNRLPELIAAGAAKRMRIYWNPSPCEEALREIPFERVSCLFCNEGEGAWFSGTSDVRATLAWFAAHHPALELVLTLGSKGACLLQGGRVCYQPAVAVTPVDTTGAGDTFTGYFVAAEAASLPGETALRRAVLAAAIAVTRPGAAQAIPSADALETCGLSVPPQQTAPVSAL